MLTAESDILRDRLQIAMQDLAQARRFGLLLLEEGDPSAGNILQLGREDADQRQRTIRTALEIALVVAYARPFTQHRDRHGRREAPLKNILDCLAEVERQRHAHYVSVIRHQEFAHSDASRYDISWHELRVGSAKPLRMPIMRNPFALFRLPRCAVCLPTVKS